jgi:hypothetical protein
MNVTSGQSLMGETLDVSDAHESAVMKKQPENTPAYAINYGVSATIVQILQYYCKPTHL